MTGPESIQPSDNKEQDWEAVLASEGMPSEIIKNEEVTTEDHELLQKIHNLQHAFMLYLARRDESMHGAHVKARVQLKESAGEFGFEPDDIDQHLDDEFIEATVDEITRLESRVIEVIEKLRTNDRLPHEKRLLSMVVNELTDEYDSFTKGELRELVEHAVHMYVERHSF